jgi:hypothetical protein
VERLGFSAAWIDADIIDTTKTDASTRNKPPHFIFGRAFGVSLNLKYACGRFFINKQIITYKGRNLGIWRFGLSDLWVSFILLAQLDILLL